MLNQAVILCGGFGKRLMPITKKIPKPMAMVNGKPFLSYLIEQCKNNGINKILLLCGYKFKIIKKYFGSGKKYGVNIQYHTNIPQIETYKRIYDARNFLEKEFLLLYSDNYSSLNLHDLYSNYKKLKSKLIISVSKKKRGNLIINKRKKKVIKYFFSKSNKSEFVDIGYMIVNKNLLVSNYPNTNVSFNFLLKKLSIKKKIDYFFNDTGYLSISDIKRLMISRIFFKSNYILIDRDGVLNKKNQNHYYVRNLNELKINHALIQKLRKIIKNHKLICISNQAGIATGDLNYYNLRKINNKILTELKKYKINLKHFFISPHHYSSNNFHRKPNHGLFLKAAKKYKVVLDRTFYIGDDIRDIEASYNAKTKCLYVGSEKLNLILKKKYKYTLNFAN
jgi:D-glycero-alpha-D-manno-heptose 1-phosphate guanylyltransferase